MKNEKTENWQHKLEGYAKERNAGHYGHDWVVKEQEAGVQGNILRKKQNKVKVVEEDGKQIERTRRGRERKTISIYLINF